jgi:hypothetical protein
MTYVSGATESHEAPQRRQMAPRPNFQLSVSFIQVRYSTWHVGELQSAHVSCFVFKAASYVANMRSEIDFQRFPIDTSVLLEALRYKSEGRGFDSRWGRWDFSLI